MTGPFRPTVRMRLALALAVVLVFAVPLHGGTDLVTAREAIVRAVSDRMGQAVEVEILALELPGDAPARFIEATPDPAARLGRAVRFVLIPEQGRRVVVSATLRVVVDHVVARHDLRRGATVVAEDVSVVRAELENTPLRRLPTGDQVIGSRVLRPVPAEAVVLPGAVAVRRAVEPGDLITGVALVGTIRVSAELKATDGGETGDMIRVVNQDTRRILRGRIIGEGLVEVGYAR